jgi:hypothetical protein
MNSIHKEYFKSIFLAFLGFFYFAPHSFAMNEQRGYRVQHGAEEYVMDSQTGLPVYTGTTNQCMLFDLSTCQTFSGREDLFCSAIKVPCATAEGIASGNLHTFGVQLPSPGGSTLKDSNPMYSVPAGTGGNHSASHSFQPGVNSWTIHHAGALPGGAGGFGGYSTPQLNLLSSQVPMSPPVRSPSIVKTSIQNQEHLHQLMDSEKAKRQHFEALSKSNQALVKNIAEHHTNSMDFTETQRKLRSVLAESFRKFRIPASQLMGSTGMWNPTDDPVLMNQAIQGISDLIASYQVYEAILPELSPQDSPSLQAKFKENFKKLAASCQKIASRENFGTSFDEFRESKRELDTLLRQSILNPIPLSSSGDSVEGQEIRAMLSDVLLAEKLYQNLGEQPKQSLNFSEEEFQTQANHLESALLFSDYLASHGYHEPYQKLKESLAPYVEAFRGALRGMLKGAATVGAGAAAVAILPEAVTLTAATTAMGYGIYKGIHAISESDDGIRGLFNRNWQAFKDSSNERQAEIVGEASTELAGLIYGGRLVQPIREVFRKGVEFSLKRFALSRTTEMLATESIISAETAAAIEGRANINLDEAVEMAQREEVAGRISRAVNLNESKAANHHSNENSFTQKVIEEEIKIQESATLGARHGPLNPGKLHEIPAGDIPVAENGVNSVGNTFRSSSYTTRVTERPLIAYRLERFETQINPKTGLPVREALPPYYTTIRPAGELQGRIDSALLRSWGNRTHVTEIEIPSGQTIHEGFAGNQELFPELFTGENLAGGGPQIYVEHVPNTWFRRSWRLSE